MFFADVHDQFIAGRHSIPTWSTKACVHTIRNLDHHAVLSCRIVKDEFHDKHPQECTKEALITLEKTTEAYMVEVITESHC
jgi:hypothetical protein